MAGRLRRTLAALVPKGYADYRARRGEEHVRAMRDRRLAAARGPRPAGGVSVDEAVRFLASRGLDEREVRAGSMPEESLEYVATFLAELPRDRPLAGLHVGNFVGVSLAHLAATLRAVHPGSRVVSIDPNITHRGIADPAGHAAALLARFGLLDANLVVTGYTLEQNTGDDDWSAPADSVEAERRPEQVLPNLAALTGSAFDVVVIDGNHDSAYLARELEHLERLLRPGGLLVIDDVDPSAWPQVAATFDDLAAGGRFEELGRDGRVGVLRLR